MRARPRGVHLRDAAAHVRNAELSLKRAREDPTPTPAPDRDLDMPMLELMRALQKVRYRLVRWQRRVSS